MGASVSGLELVRHALEVVDPEAVVTRQDVARQVALEAVPVVALRLPLLQGGRQGTAQVMTPPAPTCPPAAAGDFEEIERLPT